MDVATNKNAFYNPASDSRNYIHILHDLLLIIENIAKGKAYVSTLSVDSTIKYRINIPSYQPTVIVLYEKKNIQRKDLYDSCNISETLKPNSNSLSSECIQNANARLTSSVRTTDKCTNFFSLISDLKSKSNIVAKEMPVTESQNKVDGHGNFPGVSNVEEESSLVKQSDCKVNEDITEGLLSKTSQVGNQFSDASITSDRMRQCEEGTFKRNELFLYTCDYCDKQLLSLSKKREHEKKHTGEKPFACRICGNRFAHLSNKKRHEKIHDIKEHYSCRFCGLTFFNHYLMQKHERTHTEKYSNDHVPDITDSQNKANELQNSSEVCSAEESSSSFKQSNFKGNEETKEGILNKTHQVRNCYDQKQFSDVTIRNNERRNRKEYTCDYCDKKLISLSRKREHEKKHTGVKPFACRICGNRFAHLSNKKRHEKIHDNKEHYSCRFCGLTFFNLYLMQKHERTHTVKYSIFHVPVKTDSQNKANELQDSSEVNRAEESLSSVRQSNFKENEETKAGILNKTLQVGNQSLDVTIRNNDRRNRKEYTCDYCDKKLISLSKKREHEKKHTGEKPFACRICGYRFAHLSNKKIHEKLHDNKEHYSCRTCGKTFFNLIIMRTHEKMHTTLEDSNDHIREKTIPEQNPESMQENLLPCYYCPKKFTILSALRAHERNHAGRKPHECAFCGKKFSHYSLRKRHERIHTDEKPYSCRFCDKAFVSRMQQDRHETIHTREQQPHDDNCKKKVKQKAETMLKKRFSCSFCAQKFSTLWKKETHERVHTGENAFPCRFCDKTFTQQRYKIIHERMHLGQKPYSCNFCSKTFYQIISKNKHELIHTSEMPYSCSFCEKTFRYVCSKQIHECIHTGMKPFTCTYCDRTFALLHFKKKHERTHTLALKAERAGKKDQGPSPSAFCDSIFPAEISIIQHEKSAHSVTNLPKRTVFFACKYCKKCFSDLSSKCSHEITHMGEKLYDSSFGNEILHPPSENGRKATRIDPSRQLNITEAHSCRYCGEKFSDVSQLTTHEVIHKSEKPYSCSYCNRKFSHITWKLIHERTHSVEKDCSCSFCGKTFPLLTSKHAHERTHLSENPHLVKENYSCSFCDETFPLLTSKHAHERTHLSESTHLLIKPCNCIPCLRSSGKLSEENKYSEKLTITLD